MENRKSEIVGNMMRGTQIIKSLSDALRDRGGNDSHLLRILGDKTLSVRIAELIISAVVLPVANVAWKLVFTWILAVCRFTSYVNPDITAENFPLQNGDLTVKEIFDIDIPRHMSTEEVLAYLDQQGYRAATFVELLYWWLTNPAKQTDCLVFALGSVWGGHAPFVNGNDSCRNLGLTSLAYGWNTGCRFAAVRK